MAIDLTKDKNYRKNLSGVELKDDMGVTYKFPAVAESDGFKGLIAECPRKNVEETARYVRLTDNLVFITPDLAHEFKRNLVKQAEENLPRFE